MTRREQIQNAIDADWPDDFCYGFEAGAEWADKNPSDEKKKKYNDMPDAIPLLKEIDIFAIIRTLNSTQAQLAVAVEALKEYAVLSNLVLKPYSSSDLEVAEVATKVMRQAFEPYCQVAQEALAKIESLGVK